MSRPGSFETAYRAVEEALAQTYRVPDKAKGAFKGKLGFMQKQGVLGPRNRPGRGVALVYRADQYHRLVFACELFEFGVAPSMVLDLVKARWERRLAGIFQQASRIATRDPSDADIILHMGGVHLMTDAWSDAVPNVNSCPLGKLPDYIRMWMMMGPDDPAGLPPRALIVNLSARLREFYRWLGIVEARSDRGASGRGRR